MKEILLVVSFIVLTGRLTSQNAIKHLKKDTTLFTFNSSSIKKLQKLGLNSQKIDFYSSNNYPNLNLILKYNHRKSIYTVFAYTFSGFALTSILLAISFLKKSGISNVLGEVFLVNGVISTGISIPFWTGKIIQQRKRDKLIKLF